MSVEKVRAYLTPYGVAQRIRELEVSSATVELAAGGGGGGAGNGRLQVSLSHQEPSVFSLIRCFLSSI